jgi:hypothetical protein
MKSFPFAAFAALSLCCCAEACSSSRHHKAIPNSLNNVVDNFPNLFSFDRSPLAQVKEASLCPKKADLKWCRLVEVDLAALTAAKMKLPMKYSDPAANLILKKVSQEGLEMALESEKSRATATIVYKVIICQLWNCIVWFFFNLVRCCIL